jgi:hypothetical protein
MLRCSAAEELELDIIYMFSSKKMLVACGWSKISDLWWETKLTIVV